MTKTATLEHAVHDGMDFGIPATALASDADLLQTPVAEVEARAAKAPSALTLVPPKPAPPARNNALAAQKAEVEVVETSTTVEDAAEQGAEITNLGHSFQYDEETYWIQAADTWDLDVFELQESGKLISACKLMLGDDQWAKFKTKPRKAKDFNDMFLIAMKALGTKSG